MVIVLAISLFTTRQVLRALGVEDYGVFEVVAGFVAMFGFLNTSMSNGIQRFLNFELGKSDKDRVNRVFSTSLLIQLLLAFLIVVITESIGIWYIYNKMVIPEGRLLAALWIFQFAIIGFLFSIMQAPFTAAVMAHEHMDFFALMSIINAVLNLVIVFILPLFRGDLLILYGFFVAVIHALVFLLYFVYCRIHFKEIKIKLLFDKTLFKSMLGFSGWNVFGSLSNVLRNHGINLILNIFFGPVVNAARGVAMQINAGVTSFVTNILIPVRPQVIQSYARGDLNRTMNLTYTISKFCLFLLFLISLPICMDINFVLRVWLGDVIPDHTQNFCIIIILTSFVLIPMSSLATLVHASGNMRNYQVVGSIVKVLSVPLSYVVLSFGFAPEWAFALVFIFDVIGFVVGMFIIRTLMPFSISEYFRRVLIPLIPMFVFGLLSVFCIIKVMPLGLIRFIIVLIVGSIVALSSFYYIALSKVEKEIINGYILNIIHKLKHD